MNTYLTMFNTCLATEVSLSCYLQQVLEQQDRNKQAGMMTELVRDFLDPGEFYKSINEIGIDFFCGVPDSLLKGSV